MGTDITKTYGAEGKFTGVIMDPTKILIVGLDTPDPTDPADPLFQLRDPDRIKLDVTDMAAAMVIHGWRGQAVKVRKIGDHVYAVDGRRRIRAAREANKALKKKGADYLIQVEAIPERANDLLTTVVVANEHRIDDSVLAKARKAERMGLLNQTPEQIAAAFGVSKMTLVNWANLLKCHPKILAQVEAGKLNPTICYELGKLPQDEQLKAIEQAKAEAAAAGEDEGKALKGRKGRGRVKKGQPGEKWDRWSSPMLRELQENLTPTDEEPHEDEYQTLIFEFLNCILADDETGKGLREWKSVHTEVRRILRKKGQAEKE